MNFRLSNVLLALVLILTSGSVQANSCKEAFSKKKSTTNQFNPGILRTGDIRGVFQKDFDLGFVKIFAESLTEYLKEKTSLEQAEVLIAHDARIASLPISDLLAEELSQRGVLVNKVGLASTPMAYHLLSEQQKTAVVVVTASHNPKEYAGIKTVLHPRYSTVNSAPELKKFILKNKDMSESSNSLSEKAPIRDLQNPESSYVSSLQKEFQGVSFDSFVIDTSHGSAGPVTKKVFSALGLKPHYINTEPDGNFPSHGPDPTKSANLTQLRQKMKETNSRLGIAFDGDGDRIVVLAPDGRIIEADQFAYLFLEDMMRPGFNRIVTDIKVSNWFLNKMIKKGFQIAVTKTGYYFLKEEIDAEGALMAFERSGHIVFNDRPERGHDDGLYNALRLIELIDKRGWDYVEKRYDEVHHFKTVDLTAKNLIFESKDKVINHLKYYFDWKGENYFDLDGIRISRGDSWTVFRFSNTENLAVLTVQAQSKEELADITEEFSLVLRTEFKMVD